MLSNLHGEEKPDDPLHTGIRILKHVLCLQIILQESLATLLFHLHFVLFSSSLCAIQKQAQMLPEAVGEPVISSLPDPVVEHAELKGGGIAVGLALFGPLTELEEAAVGPNDGWVDNGSIRGRVAHLAFPIEHINPQVQLEVLGRNWGTEARHPEVHTAAVEA